MQNLIHTKPTGDRVLLSALFTFILIAFQETVFLIEINLRKASINDNFQSGVFKLIGYRKPYRSHLVFHSPL